MTRARIERWVLTPTVVLYAAMLVVAGWPRLLHPTGVPTRFEWAVIGALETLSVTPGIEVFTGRDLPDVIDTHACFRVEGVSDGGARHTLYDDTVECKDAGTRGSDDRLAAYQRHFLALSFKHARWPGQHRSTNAYPLNHLFAITDWYCHREPSLALRTVEITGTYQTLDVKSGARARRELHEATRDCGSVELEIHPE